MSLWIKIKQKDLETYINHALLRTYCTKEEAWSLHISVKNHNTHTETGKFIYKALTQLFLRHNGCEATKVPYNNVFLANRLFTTT